MFKTKEDIANGGFDIHSGNNIPPNGTTINITGSGSASYQYFPTTITVAPVAHYNYEHAYNQVTINQISYQGTCPGDSGGAVWSRNTLYGINSSGNGRYVNPDCNEDSPRYNSAGYVPLAREVNQRFIRDNYGNLGSDRDNGGLTPPINPANKSSSGANNSSLMSSW